VVSFANLQVDNCSFTGNSVYAGNGISEGGALCIFATANITASVFTRNIANSSLASMCALILHLHINCYADV